MICDSLKSICLTKIAPLVETVRDLVPGTLEDELFFRRHQQLLRRVLLELVCYYDTGLPVCMCACHGSYLQDNERMPGSHSGVCECCPEAEGDYLNLPDWIRAAEEYALTVRDIREMPTGKMQEILFFYPDLLLRSGGRRDGVIRKPSYFFRGQKDFFTRSSGLRGSLIDTSGGESFDDIEARFSHEDFTLEVMFPSPPATRSSWFLIADHVIWCDLLSADTLVGFQGIALLWSDMEFLPFIKYEL
jgi:hypothetical protein